MKNKICVVTSSRADYGLLRFLIHKIEKSSFFDLQLVVSGSHLSKIHGHTLNEIIQDNITITQKIETISKTNTKEDIANNVGNTIKKMTNAFSSLKPDMVLLLGDRYEIFSTAIASAFLNIPIAHIHGGELTEGAIDDVLRHSITKLAHIHFTSTKIYKKRVIQMGEQPKSVFNVGSLGVDNLNKLKLVDIETLQKNLDFQFKSKNIMVTYHPVSLNENPADGINILLNALKNFKEIGIIFTYPNADILSTKIIENILNFERNNDNVKVFSNLGQIKYFSCLKYCDGVVGNSSSGIIEAPSLKTWTINIGSRQKGRVKAPSVFDVKTNKKEIVNKLNFLLNEKKSFSKINFKNPYFKKNTVDMIFKDLVKFSKEKIVNKKFFDINY